MDLRRSFKVCLVASCKHIQLEKETRFGRDALIPRDRCQLLPVVVSALGINYVGRMRLATLRRKCISPESTNNACFDLKSKIPLSQKLHLFNDQTSAVEMLN